MNVDKIIADCERHIKCGAVKPENKDKYILCRIVRERAEEYLSTPMVNLDECKEQLIIKTDQKIHEYDLNEFEAGMFRVHEATLIETRPSLGISDHSKPYYESTIIVNVDQSIQPKEDLLTRIDNTATIEPYEYPSVLYLLLPYSIAKWILIRTRNPDHYAKHQQPYDPNHGFRIFGTRI